MNPRASIPAIWSIFRAVVASGDTYTYPPDISEADYLGWAEQAKHLSTESVLCDADDVIVPKFIHDFAGHYNRPHLFAPLLARSEGS